MFLKSAAFSCIAFLCLGVTSQRTWGSSVYNPDFSNSWGPNNGFSNRPFGNANSAGTWGSNNGLGFGRRPNEQLPSSNQNWGFETDQTLGWNSNRPSKGNTGNSPNRQTDAPKRPNDKKSSPIMNQPDSSKWTNSDTFLSEDNNNGASSSWGPSNKPFSAQGISGNAKPGGWFSNTSNQPNANEILTESDDEDYNVWGSNKKKKPESTNGNFGETEVTTQKYNKNSGSKWETNNNKKQQKPADSSNSWNSNDSLQPQREKNITSGNAQNEKKQSSLDTSILDEMDKNDWYFGKESDYPKPPFRSTLNIDVGELWNFDKNRKLSQQQSNNNNNNNKGNNNNKNNRGNNNNNRGNSNSRRNREAEGAERMLCECVNVNFCEEEDMIITQEDIKFDLRPLEEFRCEKLTDVCCTKPKLKFTSRANYNEEQLRCGQRRIKENSFNELNDSIAAPGEFPWNLRLENAKINCSASLIHHKLALTAAHCVTGMQPDEVSLRAGIWNSNDEPSQRRKITKIIPHPGYNSRNPRNDIALLILETPFELTDNVNTICLPVTNDKWDSNECLVVSWDRQQIRGQVLEVLEKGIVNFLPQPECQNIMLITDLWRNYVLHDSFVCGLEKTGRELCTGDEGGFVACPSKKLPGTYLQIGIVSKGMNCDAFGRPGIFTNVLLFLDWINKNYFELGLFDDIDIRSSSV